MTQAPSKVIAFFDVDHTLLKGNSGFHTTLRLVRHGVLKKRRFLQAIYYTLASKLWDQDVKKIYQIALNDMARAPLEKLQDIGRECFELDLKKRMYKDGLALIEDHKKKGHGVMLLSAGPAMTLQSFQKYLGLAQSFAMSFDMVKDEPHLPLCHGEGKVFYALRAAQAHGVSLSDCYFYTDHISDVPLLEKVGCPVVVNPQRALKKIARMRGWTVKEFKDV